MVDETFLLLLIQFVNCWTGQGSLLGISAFWLGSGGGEPSPITITYYLLTIPTIVLPGRAAVCISNCLCSEQA